MPCQLSKRDPILAAMPRAARASPAHIASLVRAPLRLREGGRFLAPLGMTWWQHHSPSFTSQLKRGVSIPFFRFCQAPAE